MARLKSITRPSATHFTANFEDVVFFDPELPLQVGGVYVEPSLISRSGAPEPRVLAQAVRIIDSDVYERILETDRLKGLPLGFDEPKTPYNGIPLRAVRQVCRPGRSAAFTRNVRAAYGYRCALTHETMLSADGASSGLQSCHIVSVEFDGSDEIVNGILLRPDLHWHYDNGNLVIDEYHMCGLFGDCAKSLGVPSGSRISLRMPELLEHKPALKYLKAHAERFT